MMVLRQWFKVYHNAKAILSAGHLELECGERIRDDGDARCMDVSALRDWWMWPRWYARLGGRAAGAHLEF